MTHLPPVDHDTPQVSLSDSISNHLLALAKALPRPDDQAGPSRIPDDWYERSLAIASSLATASIKHLLFARGLVLTPVSQLEKKRVQEHAQLSDEAPVVKRGSDPRKRRKRDLFLAHLDQMQHHVNAALQSNVASNSTSGSLASHLPLICVLGQSPISSKELYCVDIQYPSSHQNCRHSGSATVASACPLPPPKTISAMERKLVQFLIAEEDIQEAFSSKPVGGSMGCRTSLHLFTVQKSSWVCEGWRIRRGVKLDYRGLERQERAVEVDDDEEVEAVIEIGDTLVEPQAKACEGTPSDQHAAMAVDTSDEDELSILSAALSPSKVSHKHLSTPSTPGPIGPLTVRPDSILRSTRPPLTKRTSSSMSTTRTTSDGNPSDLLKTPSATKRGRYSSDEDRSNLSMTSMSMSMSKSTSLHALSPLHLNSPMRQDPDNPLSFTCSPSSSRPTSLSFSSLAPFSTPCKPAPKPPKPDAAELLREADEEVGSEESSYRVKDDRPPGSRLFPRRESSNASDRSGSLLSKNRIKPAGLQKTKIGNGSGNGNGNGKGNGKRPASRTTSKRAPKGARFVLDCTIREDLLTLDGDQDGDAEVQMVSGSREEEEEEGEAEEEMCLFQCIVSIPSLPFLL